MIFVSDVSVKISKRELLEFIWFVYVRAESELTASLEEKLNVIKCIGAKLRDRCLRTKCCGFVAGI